MNLYLTLILRQDHSCLPYMGFALRLYGSYAFSGQNIIAVLLNTFQRYTVTCPILPFLVHCVDPLCTDILDQLHMSSHCWAQCHFAP